MTSLSEVLLRQVLFLATAPDSDVHPDVAVRQLEDVVHAIGQAPVSERSAFTAAIRARAATAAGDELQALRDLEEMLEE